MWRGGFAAFYGPFGGRGDTVITFTQSVSDSSDTDSPKVTKVTLTNMGLDPEGLRIAMPGLGYSGGWDDGLGLGVWRGESHVEVDEWDVRDAVEVVTADGTVLRPVHRIQPVHVTATAPDGESEGTGSLTIIVTGALPQYGLDG